MKTFLVVGCGPSVTNVRVPSGVTAIACNRAIEAVPAQYWIWVDRFHFDRSRFHRHAFEANWVGPAEAETYARSRVHTYRVARSWPCGDDELYLRGGTLTVAAHWAIRLGAQRLVFVGCDALAGRDRYHEWDGAPLDPKGLREHGKHLEETAAGIRLLAQAHPTLLLEDATPGSPVLQLPRPNDARDFMTGDPLCALSKDAALPRGYGRLVAVVERDDHVLMWFSDSDNVVRVVRAAINCDPALELRIIDQTQIARM